MIDELEESKHSSTAGSTAGSTNDDRHAYDGYSNCYAQSAADEGREEGADSGGPPPPPPPRAPSRFLITPFNANVKAEVTKPSQACGLSNPSTSGPYGRLSKRIAGRFVFCNRFLH